MKTVWRVPDTRDMSVEERFSSLFRAYDDGVGRNSMESLICRNARLVLDGDGAIVVETPFYDKRVVHVLRTLGARGKKTGKKRFEWTIALSRLEEYCRYLPTFMNIIDGFLSGAAFAEHHRAIVASGGTVERQDLCNEANAPVPGEIYSRCGQVYVCIRHEPTTLMEGCLMVIKRCATVEETACFRRTEKVSNVDTWGVADRPIEQTYATLSAAA